MIDDPDVSRAELEIAGTVDGTEPAAASKGDRTRLVIWGVVSLAFVAYLAFGTVGARIWRFGQLHVESKSILRTWQIQGQNLPDVSNGWMLQVLFYGSALVFVACVILGLRYLLAESGDEASGGVPDRS